MKTKNKKIKILNIVLFIVVAALTFYTIFKKNDIFLIIKSISKVNIFYIMLAIIFMLIYISCEGINIRRVLKTLNHEVSFANAFKYASVGFFFSGITPSASGGDPAQLYFMSKNQLPISHSALALLVELTSFQLICCVLAIAGLIINHNILFHKVGYLKYLIIAGIILNIIFFIFLMIMIFSRTVALKLLDIICKFLKKINYKKVNVFKEKGLSQIEEYHNCSLYLKDNKSVLIKIVLTTIVELILYHSIPYCIYLSFGLKGSNIVTFISLSAVLYTAVAFIPSPGSMGISEGGFMLIYKMLFPTTILSSAMLISRAVSFYLFIVVCGLLILIYIILNKLKESRAQKVFY